jgi:hypothetical protein
MNRILDIQKKSNQYLANFTANVVRVIEMNAEKTVDFNRLQMLKNKDADNKPLIHKSTGSDKLSKAYAKRTGKTKPDLFVRGDFQEAMFLFMPDEKEYFISSKDYKTGWLAKNYGNIFGVAPENQPKAQKINDAAIVNDYLNSVFQ